MPTPANPQYNSSSASYKLQSPHQDGISSLCFHPNKPNILLSTSWDKSFKLYNVITNQLVYEQKDEAALLCGALDSEFHFSYTAGLSGNITKCDFTRQISDSLGKHEKAVKTLKFVPQKKLLISGSWDKTCVLWDARGANNAMLQKIQCPERVYTMDVTPSGNHLVLGHAHRIICIWDLRNMKHAMATQVSKRESNIEHQIRVLACGMDNETFAIGASEGRVAMNWLDLNQNNTKHYAFRCHRARENNTDILYPVNSIAFHPIHGTFMTGGCDGKVQLWDGFQKKKLPVSFSYPSSIADVKFNCDGSLMAVASSYTFESGPRDNKLDDEIYIQKVEENSMKPLSK